MRLSVFSILLLPLTVLAANISFLIPSTPLLPNPSQLPSSTSATLARLGHSTTTRLTRRNTFDFADLTVGSYLFTIACRDFAFQLLRVDVTTNMAGDSAVLTERVDTWQTYWGNEWDNKGEYRGGDAVKDANAIVVHIQPLGMKDYYMLRSGCEYFSLARCMRVYMSNQRMLTIETLPQSPSWTCSKTP